MVIAQSVIKEVPLPVDAFVIARDAFSVYGVNTPLDNHLNMADSSSA